MCYIGKAKAIGVSNYTVGHLKEMESYASIMPHVLQVNQLIRLVCLYTEGAWSFVLCREVVSSKSGFFSGET